MTEQKEIEAKSIEELTDLVQDLSSERWVILIGSLKRCEDGYSCTLWRDKEGE